MTRLRWSSENEVASPVVPSTLSPSQPLPSRKRAIAVERALSGSPLSSIAVVMAAITPPSVFVVVMVTLYRPFVLAGLEHDPEKWMPVFRKDHAPTKKLDHDPIQFDRIMV